MKIRYVLVLSIIFYLGSFSCGQAAYVEKNHRVCHQLNTPSMQTDAVTLLTKHSFLVNFPGYQNVCFLALRTPINYQFILSNLASQELYHFVLPKTVTPKCHLIAVAFDDFNQDKFAELVIMQRCQAAANNAYYQHAIFWSRTTGWNWYYDPKVSREISNYAKYAKVKQYLQHHPEGHAPTVLLLTGQLKTDPIGFLFVPDNELLTLYEIDRYPNYMKQQATQLLPHTVRISAKLVRTYQRGQMTYKVIDLLSIDKILP